MANDQIIIGTAAAPLHTFSPDDIRGISFTRGVDVVGAELTIDLLTPVVEYPYNADSAQVIGGSDFDYIRSSDGYILCTNKRYYDFRLIPYGTAVSYYRDGALGSKAYVKNIVRIGPAAYRINAVSAIGLLESQKHYGGVYGAANPQTFSTVVSDIIGGAVSYTMDDNVANLPVYGWLPYATRRDNLHQLLFATGVMVGRNASGDMHFRFLSNDEAKVVPDSRVYVNGEVDYSALASEVQVTEHSFMALASDETVVEYDNTDGSETADHTFIAFRNAPLHDLTVTGTLTIEESGVNYAIISGTGVLSGQRYTHSTRVLTVEAENSEDMEKNVVTASECTLVTVVNSANVAARLLAYYSSKKTVSSSIVLQDEKPGDLLALNDPYYESVTGFLATAQATVSSIIKANCTIITDFVPPQGGNNFTDAILYTGSGSIDFEALLAQYPDKENDLVQAVLIQGGHGGYSGEDGGTGTPGQGALWITSVSYGKYGTPGLGGEGGAPGEAGKTLTISFHVHELASAVLAYSCGEGGASDASGGETMLGEWSSADGAIPPYGVANIFTGEIFARTGAAHGVRGGDGNGNGSTGGSVTLDGEVWFPGGRGSASSGSSYTAEGGYGGGAAVGGNGGSGGNAGSYAAGKGGDGADAQSVGDETQYGAGGPGGHGGGGAGIGGREMESYSSGGSTNYGSNGTPGKGSPGGKGGDGLIMIYV